MQAVILAAGMGRRLGAADLIKALIERHTSKIGVIYPTFEEYPNRAVRDRKDNHYLVESLKAL
jgi:choline kinase